MDTKNFYLKYNLLLKNYIRAFHFRKFLFMSRSYKSMSKNSEWNNILFILDRLVDSPDILPKNAINYLDSLNLFENNSSKNYLILLILSRLQNTIVQSYTSYKIKRTPQILPLPNSWRIFLSNNYIPCNFLLSKISWYIIVVKWYISSIRYFRYIVKEKKWHTPDGPYYSVHNIPRNSVPVTITGKENNFLDWLCRDLLFDPDFHWRVIGPASIEHDPKNRRENVQFALPYLNNKKNWYFIVSSLFILLKSLFYLFSGRWWRIIILEQRILLNYFNLIDDNNIASYYVFTQSDYALRPLWTYAAVKKKSKLSFVFYSGNIWPFELNQKKYIPCFPSYKLMSWPHIVSFEGFQTNKLRQFHPNSCFTPIKSIGFEDDASQDSDCPDNAVIIFDVTPRPITILCKSGYPPNYYQEHILIKFIDDILEAAISVNITIALKPKRRLSQHNHFLARYESYLLRKKERNLLHLLNPDIAASRHLQRAAAAISIPFTSTASVAAHMGLPSIYYDSTGQLVSSTEHDADIYKMLSNGNRVISNHDELKEWITLIKDNNIIK